MARAFASSVEAVGTHNVGFINAKKSNCFRNFSHVERKIGVGVQHDLAFGVFKTCLEGSAKFAIGFVMHDRNAFVGGGHFVGDLAGGVGRRIVDDEDVVASDLAGLDQRVARLESGRDSALNGLFLVPHRIEDREAVEMRHGLRLRSNRVRMRRPTPAAQFR